MSELAIRPVVTGNEMGPYSSAVIADGPYVFVSGQGSIIDQTYRPGTAREETRQALRNLADVLEKAGSDRRHVVHCNIYLRDIADFADVNEAYAEFFGEPHPARTTFQAGAIPFGARVEIECTATLNRQAPKSRTA